MDKEKSKYLTKDEALNILGCCESNLRYHIKKRELSTYKKLGVTHFSRQEIEELNEIKLDIKREEKAIEEYKKLPTYKKGEARFINESFKVIIELNKELEILPSTSERERFMLYIFNKCIETKSFEEVANDVGRTKERVRQIYEKQIRRFKYRAFRMRDAFNLYELLKEENAQLRLEVQETRRIAENFSDEENAELNTILNRKNKTLLTDFDLSVRCLNCLNTWDIKTVGDLVQYRRDDLLKMRNFGKKSIQELEDTLTLLGLSFSKNAYIHDN